MESIVFPLGVVIVAAGSASRMQGIDKQELEVAGVPVVIRSIRAFERCPQVEEIVVVTRPKKVEHLWELVRRFGLQKVTQVVPGGASRQQSVKNGVLALQKQSPLLAIHDGARPFVTRAVIGACQQLAGETGAATAAVLTKDTIKVAAPDGSIQETPDRSRLYLTQTPQIFRRESYLCAMEEAEAQGWDCTDDCQLLERMGQKVYLAQGDYRNIKITTPEDLPLAQVLAQEMDREEATCPDSEKKN